MINAGKYRLLLFVAAAFIIDYIPFVNLPFLWSETFFHEISHGLAALLTGGVIHNIRLNFDGSGVATTSGGVAFLVSFSGYAGSAAWGLLIYRVASAFSIRNAKYIVGAIVLMLGITLLFWARDVSSIIILLILLAMYTIPLVKPPQFLKSWFSIKSFIQLVGIFVLLDAIRSPLYLLDGRDLGDGASLAQQTFLPEIVWVLLWFSIAVACLYSLWVRSKNSADENSSA